MLASGNFLLELCVCDRGLTVTSNLAAPDAESSSGDLPKGALLFPSAVSPTPPHLMRAATLSALLSGLSAVDGLCVGSLARVGSRAHATMTQTSHFFAVVHDFNDCDVRGCTAAPRAVHRAPS